ncbi:MAG: segregation/condensation protein A [bacterium]
MHPIKIQLFEGPLDLLLQLIEQQELDITQVALSQVADQYLEHLRGLEERQPNELADFLVVAARLLVLKSKALLPYLIWEEEETGEDLERQLKMYQQFVAASQTIQQLIHRRRFSFFRLKPPMSEEVVFNPSKKLVKGQLAKIFAEVLDRLEPIVNLPQRALAKTISIKERIEKIRDLIFNKGVCTFEEILTGQCDPLRPRSAASKAEMIINFLAMLELVKQREITALQDNLFQGITIRKL